MIHRRYLNEHARLVANLRSARIRRNRREINQCARRYFGSPAAQYVIADRVVDQRLGEPKAERRERVEALKARVAPMRPCHEPVRWWCKQKRPGAYRVICDLPAVLRVRHYMIREVLDALFRPHGHIFDIRGGGRDVLARSVAAAMEEGFTHAFVGDVRDCYPSVGADALYHLPLPRQVVHSALDYRNLTYRRDHEKEREEAPSLYHGHGIPLRGRNGPSGLLQGSPSANLILAWLLNDMDHHLSSSCRLFLLSDNVIVLARSERGARRVEQVLSRYFREHQAGPFVFEGEAHNSREGFDALGYRFRLEDYGACVDLTDAHMQRIIRRMDEAIREDKAAGLTEPDRALRVLHDVRSGFRAATFLEMIVELGLDYAREELSKP